MEPIDLCFLTAGDLGRLIQRREVSPVEVVQAHLERIEKTEPVLNSFITLLPELALAEAHLAEQEIAAGNYRGPLHGVPLGLKDLYYTKGVKNTAGSRIFDDFIPDYDCTVMARFREAGAILMGKLNMHQFAYGPTRRERRLRTHAQPLRSPIGRRWFQRRIGVGSSSRPVHHHHGERYRRFHPHPFIPVRLGWPQANLRPPQPPRPDSPWLGPSTTRAQWYGQWKTAHWY